MPIVIIKNSDALDIPVEITDQRISLKDQLGLDVEAANQFVALIKNQIEKAAQKNVLINVSITDCQLKSNHPFIQTFIPMFTKITSLIDELNLSNNLLGVRGLELLSQYFNFSNGLKKLRLANNGLTNKDDLALSQLVLKMKYIETLDVSHNKGLSKITYLLTTIKDKGRHFTEINLSFCAFDDESLQDEDLNVLLVQKLDLSGNHLVTTRKASNIIQSLSNTFTQMQIEENVSNDNAVVDDIPESQLIDPSQLGKLKKTSVRGTFGPLYTGIYQQKKIFAKALEITESHQADEMLTLTQEFIEEANKLNKVKHSNIIQYFGNSIYLNQNIIIIESCDKDLFKYLTDKNHAQYPNWKECANFAVQIAGGLMCLHNNHIVHGKIRPESIGVVQNDYGLTIKIMDFESINSVHLATTTTRSRGVRGNVESKYAYLAPEQLQQTNSITDAADIYSFGMVIYSMLAMQHPFKDYTVSQIKQFYDTEWSQLLEGSSNSKQPIALPKELKNTDHYADRLEKSLWFCFFKEPSQRTTAEHLYEYFADYIHTQETSYRK